MLYIVIVVVIWEVHANNWYFLVGNWRNDGNKSNHENVVLCGATCKKNWRYITNIKCGAEEMLPNNIQMKKEDGAQETTA